MRILFVDPVCNKQYDPEVLANAPLGGTEATVVRIAGGLATRGAQVQVAQHNRIGVYDASGTTYVPFGHKRSDMPTHVVVLRAPMALLQARKQFPSASLYYWAHDMFAGQGWDKGFQAIVDSQAIPILVSDWHQSQMYDAMNQFGFKGSIPSRKIYNPIDDDLKPDETPVDPNKLVFFSSPHKGLEYTLSVFDKFKNFPELRDIKLYLANPGYFKNYETEQVNVINLGALSHHEVIKQVRSALAVFHLNHVFPETMGLVHAEANAVGTPFLSDRYGATPEMRDHPHELIDTKNVEEVINRVILWSKYGRPKVRGAPAFRLSRVIREWQDILKR